MPKYLKTAFVRELEQQVRIGELSHTRMLDLIQDEVIKNYTSTHQHQREMKTEIKNQQEMKTLTFVIADRLDELAGEWSRHTAQCEALMMAAKEVATFEQEEKDRMVDFAYKYGNLTLQQISDAFDNEYNNENL